MCGTPRYEDEAATRYLNLAVTEQKRRISLRDVESLVGVGVQVKRRRGLARWEEPTIATYAPAGSAGPKWIGSIES